jgi:hypothetical protein
VYARRRQKKAEPGPEVNSGLVYQAVAQRRLQRDLLMWQVPALGLTAQAFLLTTAGALAYGSACGGSFCADPGPYRRAEARGSPDASAWLTSAAVPGR